MGVNATIPLRFKRGAAAGLPTAATGEPLWTTDTGQLYVGLGGVNTLIGPGAVGIIADGDYGDITVSSSGAVFNIDAGVVGPTELASISAESRLLGRGEGGGAGVVQEIALGAGLSMSGTTLSASGSIQEAFQRSWFGF